MNLGSIHNLYVKLFLSLDIPRLMSALEEAHSLFHQIRDDPGKVCAMHSIIQCVLELVH